MPKMKSVKGAVKRFKVKKNGQVKRGTAFRSHILTKQDAQTRREQNTPKVVAKVDAKNITILKNWASPPKMWHLDHVEYDL